ncbi:MAG: hypothetical protein EPO26_17515 [Chloroflexota bacterium]|nr:MAG: hypothetical protein EPO26_17515 [Chloroflexota bacterium]
MPPTSALMADPPATQVVPRPPMPRPVRGRRAVILSFLVFGGLFGLAVLYAFAGEWRQRDRLLADGLRAPRAAVWMTDDGVVVVEARPGDATGILTWFSTSSGRQPIVGLPAAAAGDRDGGVVGVAPGLDGRMVVAMGACASPLCGGILAPDARGALAKAVDLANFGIAQPWGLAIDARGVAYVSDRGRDRVVGFAFDSTPARLVAELALPAGSDPRGVAVDGDGSLLIALAGRGSIVRARPGGAIEEIASGLGAVVAVGVEPSGDVLALEATTRLGAIDTPDDGRLLRVFRSAKVPEIVRTGIDRPSAITIAPDGRVYVTIRGFERDPDRAGQVIQIRRLGPIAPRRYV